MFIKTSDLIGPALDWAVAKCEGWGDYDPGEPCEKSMFASLKGDFGFALFLPDYSPSTDWAQGGPIIERLFKVEQHGDYDLPDQWVAVSLEDHSAYGPTPLVAAMRCYVASKLGDELEIPEELI